MSDKSLIEAALFVAGKGVSLKELEKLTGLEQAVLKDILEQIQMEYSQRDSGIMVEKSENSYVMRVKPEFEEKIMPMIPETDLPKSMLKTLALIAHEQPIKQTVVVRLRGNRVYHYIHQLIDLGFINAKPDGRTKLLSTTPKFREYFRVDDVKKEITRIEGPKQVTLDLPPESEGPAGAEAGVQGPQ
jgi:segregation and condensation protein B